MSKRIDIIGCGPGGQGALTLEALYAVREADLLAGPEALLSLFPDAAAEKVPVSARVDEVVPLLETHGAARSVALLVTGDPGLHSLGAQVVARLGRERCRLHPGISSLQVACARVGLAWERFTVVSLHGEAADLLALRVRGHLAALPVAFLTDGRNTPDRIAEVLVAAGRERLPMHVCSELGRPEEMVVSGTAAEVAGYTGFPGRSVVLLPRAQRGTDGGCFTGVGVGPGDPELLTLGAVRALQEADAIVVPRERGTARSLALAIAEPYVDPEKLVEVTFDTAQEGMPVRDDWADAVAERVQAGEAVVYLTLGDPMTYSTYIYLLGGLRKRLDEAAMRTLPGVTSYAAAAALSGQRLGRRDERLAVVPVGRRPLAEVREALETYECVVLLKVHRQREGLRRLLEETGRLAEAFYAAQVGLPGEWCTRDLSQLDEGPESGLALVICSPRCDPE